MNEVVSEKGLNMVDKNSLERSVIGVVSSAKMNKTITVLVERQVKHPVYGKYVKRSKKVHVHDENSLAKEGDVVRVKQTRPLSKTKTWVLDSVIKTNV